MADFNGKIFNENAFAKYVETVPRVRTNKLIKSRVFQHDENLANLFNSQTGAHYGTIPIFGRIGGQAVNYDGKTNITSDTTQTYSQAIIVRGRAKGFTEKDFSYDITSGVDFMSQMGGQISDFWEDLIQDELIDTLTGVFTESALDETKKEFIKTHVTDISGETKKENQVVNAVTLNNAIQKASGDKKDKFKVVVMHSQVATNLENLNLLEFVKYTDEKGVTRDLTLGTWNGRDVIITDEVPVEADKYTTYVLGEGAFKYADLGAKVPYEVSRDPKTNGGENTLYTRKRFVIAPVGLSYKEATKISPMKADIIKGENWEIIKSADGTSHYSLKDIPIVKIVSKG